MSHSEEKKPIYKKWWFWLIIIIVIAVIGGAGANGQKDNTTTSSQNVISDETTISENTQENKDVKVTLEQYNQVKDGMSYDEVVSIFGGKENSSSESEIAGIKSEVKTWSGNGTFSVVSIGFTDGKVSSKSQTGLE